MKIFCKNEFYYIEIVYYICVSLQGDKIFLDESVSLLSQIGIWKIHKAGIDDDTRSSVLVCVILITSHTVQVWGYCISLFCQGIPEPLFE